MEQCGHGLEASAHGAGHLQRTSGWEVRWGANRGAGWASTGPAGSGEAGGGGGFPSKILLVERSLWRQLGERIGHGPPMVIPGGWREGGSEVVVERHVGVRVDSWTMAV